MKQTRKGIALVLAAFFALSSTTTVWAETVLPENITESSAVSTPESSEAAEEIPVTSEVSESEPPESSVESEIPEESQTPELPDVSSSETESVADVSSEQPSVDTSEETSEPPLTSETTATPMPRAAVQQKRYGKSSAEYTRQAVSKLRSSDFDILLKLYPDRLPPDGGEDIPLYESGSFLYMKEGKTAILVAYMGSEPELTLPETLGGLKVVGISSTFLTMATTVISVNVPASITELEPGCFFSPALTLASINVAPGNPNYKSVDGVLFNKSGTHLISYPAGSDQGSYTVPNGTEFLDTVSFLGASIVKAELPEGVTVIDEYAFEGSMLKQIVLPDSLEAICEGTFQNSMLSSITLPKSLYYLGGGAFAGSRMTAFAVHPDNDQFAAEDGVLYNNAKTRLMEFPCLKKADHFVLPATVTGLDAYVFATNSYLRSFSLAPGSALDRLGEYAFVNCVNLTSVDLSAARKLRILEASAFESCHSLTSVKLPEGLLEIRETAFAETALTSIQLPVSLRFLGEDSLAETALTSLHIPKNVSAFLSCGVLSPQIILDENEEELVYTQIKLTVDSANPYFKLIKNVLYNGKITELLWYPMALTARSYTVPNTVTAIADQAIYNDYLEQLNIPKSVKTIGSDAIYGEQMMVFCFKGSAAEAYCKNSDVEVPYAYPSLSLNQTKATVSKGKTLQLKATLSPKLSGDAVTYTSSNSKVAKVNSTGLVTGVATGTAKITAKTASGSTRTCSITINNPVPKLKISATGINSVKLSWTSVPGASGYEVYQATSKSGKYSKVYSGSATSFTKAPLSSNKTYYYKVRSFKKSGKKVTADSYSAVLSAKPTLVNKVTASKLNVRKSPSIKSKIVGSYQKGTAITVKAVSGKWLQTSKGWCSADYVSARSAKVTGATALNVRKSPSTSGKLVKTIRKGTKLKVYAEKNGWFLTNQGGWVSGQYLR